MACAVIQKIVSSALQGTLPQFPRELDWGSVPRVIESGQVPPCPAFVGRRATPKALHLDASAWAPWNKWQGPTRVKRRWEGGRLCRERPWRLRLQRYGSQVGERRSISRGGTLKRSLVGPSTQRALGSMNLGSCNAARQQLVPKGSDGRIRLETIETRTILAPSRQDFAATF
jgi:hypothetical protein